MKDLQKIKEFFSKSMDEAVTSAYESGKEKNKSVEEGNHNAEDFKPYVVKDTNNPNFLRIFIQYPTGTGFTTALGQRTMTGQDRDYNAYKAMQIGQAVAAKLDSKYNLEDIEVSDNEAGKVIIFAVSDDFIKMNTPSIDEAKEETGVDMAKKRLDALGVKYEMSKTDKVRPFKVIYKPVNKSDKFYDEFEDIVDLFNLKGFVKTSMNEAEKEDAIDTITMDVPLFLRILEYSREDAQKDIDLHDVTDKAISLGKERGILSMEDYEEIVGGAEEIDENLTEAYVPSNIKEFAKRKGVSSLVNKVAGWAEKVGKSITGGTAIGYNYSTLVLDMTYQGSEIRINTDNDTVTLYDEPVRSFGEFQRVFADGADNNLEENVAPNHDGKAAPYGSGYKPLEERIAKALERINEDLCPAGKAYIKRRQAAGEKSSAYLSGRAVKVCKGQMSGRAKKK